MAIASAAVVVLLLTNISSVAHADPVIHKATGITFPEEIADFKLGNVENYEDKHPGLGFAYHYKNGSGISGTVYVYTAGLSPVPATIDHPLMGRLREQTVAEILELVRRRNETARQISKETLTVKADVGEIPILFDGFIVDSQSGARKTYVWLWSSRGHILKVRVTATTPELEPSQLRTFFEPIVRLAARPADWKRQVRMIIGSFPTQEESTAWMAYGLGLTDWVNKNRVAQTAPDGPFIPSFDAELHARQTQLQIWRELNERGGHSLPYMDVMLKVASSGFLREYIWRHHRQSNWEKPPVDLRMEAFQQWQTENLRDHIPLTGARIVFEWGPAK